MPSDHGFGSDNRECLLPVGPAATNDRPEEPVGQIESWAWMTAFQRRKLLAQGQILKQRTFLRAREANDGCETDPEGTKHGEQLYQNAGEDDGRCVIGNRLDGFEEAGAGNVQRG